MNNLIFHQQELVSLGMVRQNWRTDASSEMLFFFVWKFFAQRSVEVGARSVIKCTHMWLHECFGKTTRMLQSARMRNRKRKVEVYYAMVAWSTMCACVCAVCSPAQTSSKSKQCKLHHIYQNYKCYANVQLDGFELVRSTCHRRGIWKFELGSGFSLLSRRQTINKHYHE